MFSELPESRPGGQRRRLTIGASALLHAAMLWAAAHLSATARPAPIHAPEVIPLYYPAHHPAPTVQSVLRPHTGPTVPIFSAPTVEIPISLPSQLPIPATPDQWPDRLGGHQIPGQPTPGSPGDKATGTTSQPFAAGEVDRAAAPRPGAPTPVYPPDLQAAGIEGTVSVEFVVDSAGVADERRIRVVSSDYPAFAAAARAVIARTRYFPAEAHGHRVAQLVDQSFVFRITR
jgi:TonB family protein